MGNGRPQVKLGTPGTLKKQQPAANSIIRIHPAIGVARVGNADGTVAGGGLAADQFFIGPETFMAEANVGETFKIGGKIKRQAARFHVWLYKKDAKGREIPDRELTLADVKDIEWSVHLANRKASFFNFAGPRGEANAFATAARRNAGFAGDRAKLEIDEGPRTISGASQAGSKFAFKNSKASIPIDTLGELQTDAKGRLLVLGGKGQSASPKSAAIGNYANNDDWFDDVSDGPVDATIVLKDGKKVAAVGAWVLVGPPDFAPPLDQVITLYDRMVDVIVNDLTIPVTDGLFTEYEKNRGLSWIAELKAGTYKPSFTWDILPIFERSFLATQVHDGSSSKSSGPSFMPAYHSMLASNMWTTLANEAKANEPTRKMIFDYLHEPGKPAGLTALVHRMPQLWGDDYDGPVSSPTHLLSLTRTQYKMLEKWRDGDFINDYGKAKIQLLDGPEMIDRAGLDTCVGGAFFPGIETSWLIRQKVLYSAPFRIDRKASFGPVKVGAGLFSQQMALPWQADFWACAKDPDASYADKPMVGWWPSQRPDDVFKDVGAASWSRLEWARGIGGFVDMVHKWHTRGFVVKVGSDYLETEGP